MKKVVIAESSPTIKSVADSLLRQSGFDVVCTSDGLQAWEVISAEKPDLVLVGLSLSGISGLELCRQISSDRMTGGIPVVLMIGAGDSPREDELVACGARGRLKKPFSPKDLLDMAGKLAGQRQSGVSQGHSAAKPETKFVTQVSSTQHMKKKQEAYNLEWLDLSDTTTSGNFSKVASFDLANEDQALVIDDDQYGLANPISIPEPEEPPAPPVEDKDDDYDWFVGEMKREMEGKLSESRKAEGRVTDVPKISNDIGFEDIRPSDNPDRQAPRNKTAAMPVGEQSQFSPAGERGSLRAIPPAINLSDEQIARIADQIAAKLAAHILARLDKGLLMDAIRAGLRS